MRGLQLCTTTVRRRPWSYYGRTRHDNCATQTFSGRRRRGYRGSGCATLWAECSGPKGRPISAPRARRRRHCGARSVRADCGCVRAFTICYCVFYCHRTRVLYMQARTPGVHCEVVRGPGEGFVLSKVTDRGRLIYTIICNTRKTH